MDIPSSPPPMAPPAHSSRKRGRPLYSSCLASSPGTPKKARAELKMPPNSPVKLEILSSPRSSLARALYEPEGYLEDGDVTGYLDSDRGEDARDKRESKDGDVTDSDEVEYLDSDREDARDERESEDGNLTDEAPMATGACAEAYLPAVSN
jgi:hypothetical protein